MSSSGLTVSKKVVSMSLDWALVIAVEREEREINWVDLE